MSENSALPIILGRGHFPREPLEVETTLQLAEKALANSEYDQSSTLFARVVCSLKELGRENTPHYARALDGQGEAQGALAQWEDSVTVLEEALQLRRQLHGAKHLDVATSLHNLGLVYKRKGDYSMAETNLNEACNMRKELLGKDDRLYASSLWAIGQLLALQGMWDKALEASLEAFNVNQRAGHLAGAAQCLSDAAEVHCRKNNHKEALTLAKQAFDMACEIWDKSHTHFLDIQSRLAQIYCESGDLLHAEQIQAEVVNNLRSKPGLKNNPTTGAELTNLGVIRLHLGLYRDAQLNLEEGVKILQEKLGENHPNAAAGLLNLASAYGKLGDFDRAASCFEESMRLAEGRNPQLHVMAKQNLATAIFDTGNLVRSEELGQDLLQNHLDTLKHMPHIHALVLQTLGQVQREKGNTLEAEQSLKKANDIMIDALTESHPNVATIFEQIGRVHLASGNFQGAEVAFEKARDIRKKCLGLHHMDYAQSLTSMAELLHATGNFAKSVKLLLEASINLKLLEKTFPALSVLKRLQMVARLARAARILPLVIQSWRKAGLGVDSLQECKDDERQSFGYLLQFRSILFHSQAEEMQVKEVMESLSGTQRSELETIVQQLQCARQKLASSALDTEDTEENAAYSSLKEVEELETQRSILLSNCGASICPKSSTTDPVEKVMEFLPPNSGLLEYVQTENLSEGGEPRYIAFLLKHGKNGPELHMLELDDKHLDSNVQKFLENLWKNTKQPKHLHVGCHLRESIFDPALKCFPTDAPPSHIFIAADGSLNRLPFYALPLDRQTQTYLLHKEYTLSYVISGLTMRGRQPVTCTPNWSLVVAGPNHDETAIEDTDAASDQKAFEEHALHGEDQEALRGGEFGELTFAKNEGEKVRQHLANAFPGTVKLLTDHFATAAQVRKHLCKPPAFLHFACHAYFAAHHADEHSARATFSGLDRLRSTKEPLLRVGLAMAGSRAWQIEIEKPKESRKISGHSCFITGMDLLVANLSGTRLAVLSACNTGLGDIWQGQGVAGLCRAMQLAGAETVLANHFLVHDQKSADLMSDFYPQLLCPTGDEPFQLAKILRNAQRKLFEMDHRPIYWATFALCGSTACFPPRNEQADA